MTAALLGLRFVLELALLAAFAAAGWSLGPTSWSSWLLALSLPVAAATVWGWVLSPKARLSLPLTPRLVIELTLFVTAAGLLWLAGQQTLGVLLLVAELVVLGGLLATGQRPGRDRAHTAD